MKTVIEVPFFATDNNLFQLLLGENKNIRETKYHDFLFLEFELDAAHEIYFYCMDYIPEKGNISLTDKIIPKAPFVFFLVEPDAESFSETAENMFSEYVENYTTPAFVIRTVPSSEKEKQTEENLNPDLKGLEIIFTESENQDFTKHILTEAIKKVIPKNL
jgi:hypothetical protein